jgi:acyl-CoA hydrolase
MPYTFGDGEIAVDTLDAVVEADESLGGAHGVGGTDAAAERIGTLVAERVVDGSTLQLGIGAVPNATLPGLSTRRGLGVWSEMISDGLLALDAAGALDADRDIIASFVIGSPALYAYLDRNPRVRIARTETTNDPGRIAANPRMTSINTRSASTCSARRTPRASTRAFTPASAGRPTSSWGRCTPPGARR